MEEIEELEELLHIHEITEADINKRMKQIIREHKQFMRQLEKKCENQVQMLKKILKRAEITNPEYKCPTCERCFSNRSNLNFHLRESRRRCNKPKPLPEIEFERPTDESHLDDIECIQELKIQHLIEIENLKTSYVTKIDTLKEQIEQEQNTVKNFVCKCYRHFLCVGTLNEHKLKCKA